MNSKIRRLLTWARDAWLVLGIALLLVILLELVSWAFDSQTQSADPRAYADTYDGADWTAEYYREFWESHQATWHPYTYWRRKPYRGRYVNVDSQGVRKTWGPPAGQGDGNARRKIFMFGGSTLWGSGARDDFTIPSLLEKQLAAHHVDAQVVNFGESGYVSTQEVVLLMLELRKGNLPDLVIFYDGVNDTFSAYQQGRAGLPHNELNRVSEFNTSQKIKPITLLEALRRNLFTAKALISILVRFGLGGHSENAAQTNSQRGRGASRSDDESLADEVLDVYAENIRIVNSLAQTYSFRALYYWQPTVFDKRSITKFEAAAKEEEWKLQPFVETTYEHLRRRNLAVSSEAGFHDVSLLLSDKAEPLYVDWCHLGETGNEYVARRIAEDVLSMTKGQ